VLVLWVEAGIGGAGIGLLYVSFKVVPLVVALAVAAGVLLAAPQLRRLSMTGRQGTGMLRRSRHVDPPPTRPR
jgi:hypothetical protein